MKRIWDNDHYHQECPACGYVYEQYDNEWKNWEANREKSPFKTVTYPQVTVCYNDEQGSIDEPVILMCPECGTIQAIVD